MSEKQEKVSAPGTGAAYAFSWPVFVLSFGWMLYAIFGVNNLVLSAIFAFLKDSSGFLTFLCFVVIAAALLRRQKQYCLAVLNAVNIVLLNQLYLNSRWQALYETVRKFFAELNWPKVFFFGAMLAVAAYCAYAGLKQRRKNRSQEVAEPQQASDGAASGEQDAAPQASDGSGENPDPVAGQTAVPDSAPAQTSGPQSTPPSGPAHPVSSGQSNGRETASAGSVFLTACLAVIIVFIGEILVFDIWKLAPLPDSLGAIANVLPVLAILAAGGILAPLVYRMFRGAGKTFRFDNIRATALLAMLSELGLILAIVLNGEDKFPDFLDGFLDGIVSNSLVALPLILITLFIILDIAISIIMKIVFGKNSRDWIAKTEERIVLIERGLTLFVCNLIIGFINLLLFIPDFFNHIGQLLLDEDDFFPQEKIKISKLSQGKTNAPATGHTPGGAEAVEEEAANEEKK